MNYKKYSDAEILESYTTMLDYSGKANDQIETEIESRGGLEQVRNNVSNGNIVPNEIKRIKALLYTLYKQNPNPDAIKHAIHSDILSPLELSEVVDKTIPSLKAHLKDGAITTRTIIGSLVGFVIASLAGGCIWCYSIIKTGRMNYMLTTIILVISYAIIWLLTKQSRNNLLVFLATFASAAVAMVLGLWFCSLITG